MNKRIFSIISLIITVCICLSACSFGGKKEYTLSNPNSNEKTRAMYDYICSCFGEKVLSGQQESTWVEENYELKLIEKATGKLPAICGFDYMNDDFAGVNERAIEWAQKGGIVTICWHTGADFTGEWVDSQEDEITNWEQILTEGTEENKKFLEDMDKAAIALKELQNNNITVLWRPFHEFDGNWFWWSKGGAESFKKLWQMMYNRFTNHWELNNLIWVLGYSHKAEEQREWYPGDEYCDIIGADSYEGGVQQPLYKAVKKVTKNKPICFHECGANPTAEEFEKTAWNYFMTWHTTYLTDSNTEEQLKDLYNSEIVITLDELPQF